ncbi:hypothetical protein N7494_002518 [Penicillium frequentans]|uniref:3'-5' exonuclease domain-containing protein n=1 Tax=Penicillium frequentans TaxID=3151616 RepID=A0AAD6D3Z9_9EURO|nr:hypothetical protein N7494_002518 [Penicillium glabrum]
MPVVQNANVGESFSGPEVFLVVCQCNVLRTSSRGTPHETIQHRYHKSRRLTNRELRRTFSSTSATRIRLEDDENEDLEPPKNSRASKRPVRRPPPGPPKDLRTIILSREPKPRKPKYIDPEKVREIEAKVQMLPDPHQLVNEFLDTRYIHLEDQIATALFTTQGIFCSHIEVLKSLVLCSEADCQRIELDYCKLVYHNTPQWTAAISDIEKAVTRLRYKFITGRIEDSQLFIYRTRELLEREYLSPRQSARAKIDRLLQPTEDMREEYRSLQTLGMAVLTGLKAIKSLIIQLKVLDEQGPDLPGPGFQDFQNVLEAHKQDFAMAAHKHRAEWFARVQNTTLVASQFWSAKKLTTTLLEIANRLRKSYTKKWSGVKPANSPELNKVWRQLDVMALFETQQALDMSLQYEVWILMKSLEGKFGPMWPGLDSDASREIQKNLHQFSVKFNRSRKLFTAELEMYRLANWARLNVEEKLHKLGEPNDTQERGLFRVLKPLSQDHSRFNHWANHFVAVSFKNWKLNRLLKFSMEESEENMHNHYVRLAEDYLEQMSRPSSFVPEIGTTETREIKRPLFPMLKRIGLNEASIAPEAPSLPSKDAAKSTSSSPPQALTTTGPKASPRDSPPWPEQEHTVQHLKIRPLIEKSSKMPIEDSAEEIVDQNSRKTHNEQSARQHERQRDVKQSAKDLTDIRLPRPLKPPKAPQHKSRSMPRPESSQELPVEEATAASRSKSLVRSSSVWGFFARSGGSADVSRESISRAKSNRSVRQLPAKEVTPTSKAASPTKKNAVASTALKDESRRLIQRPNLTKRQRQPALGPSRSPYRVRYVQRRLDLDFLSGQSAGIRPYSTRAYFSEAKANDSSVACIDEQSLPLGGPSPGESAVGQEEIVKDGAPPLFWTHSSQRGPGGQKLIVHYCRTLESTEEVARLFLGSKVIGFDMEWKAQASAWDSIQSNLSLIQVANEERIALFQIALFKPGQTLKDLVAPSLKQLLESSDITKVGVSIKADATRLRKYLGVEARSIFELSHLFKLVKYGLTQPKLVNKRGVNLSDQAEEHLGLPLEKSEDVRCGDWTRPLNYRQVQYAATDPYACICLFNVMDQKRQAMDSVPPLPAHAELNLPIVLPPREKEPIASSPADDPGDIDVRS